MIRKAEIKDIPRIAEIIVFGKRMAYRNIFNNDIVSFNNLQVIDIAKKYYKNNSFIYNMLIFDDGIIKGVINKLPIKNTIEICDFYVEPFFIGNGIGTHLLKHLIEEVKLQKVTVIYLWVVKENLSARKFYEQNGFYTTGKTAIIEGTNKIDIYYELSLVY